MLHWTEAYSTGISEIDDQHRSIFRFINDLYHQTCGAGDKQSLMRSIHFLDDYAKNHFKFEELLMDTHKCPLAEENRRQHAFFLEKCNEFRTKIEKNDFDETTVLELYSYVRNWITRHILEIDSKLRHNTHPTL